MRFGIHQSTKRKTRHKIMAQPNKSLERRRNHALSLCKANFNRCSFPPRSIQSFGSPIFSMADSMLRENYQRSASNRRLLNMNRRRFLKVRADQSIVCSILQWLIEDCRIIETRSAFSSKILCGESRRFVERNPNQSLQRSAPTHFHAARLALN